MLAEVDPSGSSSATGLMRGRLDMGRGVRSLVTSMAFRQGNPHKEFPLQLQDISGTHVRLLRNFDEPRQAQIVSYGALAAAFAAEPMDVLVDVGRIGQIPDTTAMRAAADVMVVLLEPTVRAVRAVDVRLREWKELQRRTDDVVLYLCGRGPYTSSDVSHALNHPVEGEIPWDPTVADVWNHGLEATRKYRTSKLARAAVDMSERLIALTDSRRAQFGVDTAANGRAHA